MLLFYLGELLVLLPVGCFAPGFFFIRKLRWNPLEKLCGSLGLSLILLYLASWAIYCVGPRGNHMPVHAAPFQALWLVCLGLAAASWKDIVRLFRFQAVRKALAGFGFLLLWAGLFVAIIRNFSGALWFGDWLEHFQRALFFLQHFPSETPIFPGYALSARPPMINVIAAFFLAETSDRFELFQAVLVFLNLLLFLPCYLMMPALGRRAKRRTWMLVLFFAASPVVMQNVTYSWTKASAAFFVVLGLWFYLAGWRKHDTVRTTAAFVSLAAGLLAHYSAGPYVAILTLHYLIRVFPRRPHKWRELAAIASLCGVLVGTWIGWSLAVYGAHYTFASNSSVTLSQEYEGGMAEKIANNLFDSIVPVVARDPSLLDRFEGQRWEGRVRDKAFIFYQVNAIFGMGLVGGPLILWLAYRSLWRKPKPESPPPPARGKKPPPPVPARRSTTPERRFWMILIVAGLVLGIAVVGERDPMGVAHLTLLSLQTLGIAMLAAAPWDRKMLAALVLAGCLIDFSLGVFLQARVESFDNSSSSIVFQPMVVTSQGFQKAAPGPDSLGRSAWNNWLVKRQLSAYDWMYPPMHAKYGQIPGFDAAFQKMVQQARSDDTLVWQDWFTHHGGEVLFLGDHVSDFGRTVATGMLLILFLGLMGGAWRIA